MESYVLWSFLSGLFYQEDIFKRYPCCKVRTLFFFLWLYHVLSIFSSVDEHLGSSRFLAIMIMLLGTFVYTFLHEERFLVFFGIYARMA